MFSRYVVIGFSAIVLILFILFGTWQDKQATKGLIDNLEFNGVITAFNRDGREMYIHLGQNQVNPGWTGIEMERHLQLGDSISKQKFSDKIVLWRREDNGKFVKHMSFTIR